MLNWLSAGHCALWFNHSVEAGFSVRNASIRVSGAAEGEECACTSERLCVKPGFDPLLSPLREEPQRRQKMGGIRLAVHMFLWSLSAVYMFAFASVYVQIPGEV